ncbi:acyl-CoA/acyl-ACP dehydrogenase [Streptomyces sp. PTM05]|uniref:Acyl-CoA/acyl-ACP dehydrogenase n=1 Tax=Streptantibioticus parmotrematis TaxID=2873249 RepID=A0ABS7QNI2_9ACTN|nr:acyl-CoA dehydrogenase family protein [Streptantibioticus parmotrematis]MBY8884727.1 acyl-CoA/acyl-ACP dehydrogenase [Streptantibioticus parmotrematis]
MGESVDRAAALVTELAAGQAEEWDERAELPRELIRELGAKGALCADVPESFGGLGLDSQDNGRLIAATGETCSSLRSVMTSQGIAAWAVSRFGSAAQKAEFLPRLTSGETAGVAFSEPAAGSDLAAMSTEIVQDGDTIVVTGSKSWVTGAHYASLLVVFGRFGNGAAMVVVPTDAPGVSVERIPSPLGCRAAGHASVRMDRVRVPAHHLLGGAGMPIMMLVSSPLTHGRISVAWGCVGILRACLREVVRHSSQRVAFGSPLSQHQLVQRHIAELYAGERTATYACEHASLEWDTKKPRYMATAVLAKHVAAEQAARGAASAVQVLASAGARSSHVVARAYRDAKLMEIIEGSSEISQVLLADEAMTVWA